MNELYHYGVKGMKWGVRRYQNKDGGHTPEGRERDRIRKNEARRKKREGRPTDTVFVSGSSKTQFKDSGYFRPELHTSIKRQLNMEMKRNSKFIVGDAPGIDRQVQDYLKKKKYPNVEVYSPGSSSRYKADSDWKNIFVNKPGTIEGSKEWLAAKDEVMSEKATKGLAIILDEGSSATRKNIQRLIDQNKNVSVFELSRHGRHHDRWTR